MIFLSKDWTLVDKNQIEEITMNITTIVSIVSVIIGGFIGFISSYFIWKMQVKHNKKNIAKGFYIEISSLERTLE